MGKEGKYQHVIPAYHDYIIIYANIKVSSHYYIKIKVRQPTTNGQPQTKKEGTQ